MTSHISSIHIDDKIISQQVHIIRQLGELNYRFKSHILSNTTLETERKRLKNIAREK